MGPRARQRPLWSRFTPTWTKFQHPKAVKSAALMRTIRVQKMLKMEKKSSWFDVNIRNKSTNVTARLRDWYQFLKVKVVTVIAPDEFYVRSSEDMKYYEQLQKIINNYVANTPVIYDPEINLSNKTFVLIFSSVYNKWCRACIVEEDDVTYPVKFKASSDEDTYPDRLGVNVYLFDYCYKENSVQLSQLLPCPEHLADLNKFPIRITRCLIDGIMPNRAESDWNTETNYEVYKYLMRKEIWVAQSGISFIDEEKRIATHHVAVKLTRGTKSGCEMTLGNLDDILVYTDFARWDVLNEYQRDFSKEYYHGSIKRVPSLPGLVYDDDCKEIDEDVQQQNIENSISSIGLKLGLTLTLEARSHFDFHGEDELHGGWMTTVEYDGFFLGARSSSKESSCVTLSSLDINQTLSFNSLIDSCSRSFLSTNPKSSDFTELLNGIKEIL